jgi:hypothetical protein
MIGASWLESRIVHRMGDANVIDPPTDLSYKPSEVFGVLEVISGKC